ncbi:MAG: branched-chain amino acid ABC transporter substrate-binding protein [Chloroflexota bacterium]|nr:branched-chain amino acid ABC transporter substrate-binding protein [Chloroflexota bacterium]
MSVQNSPLFRYIIFLLILLLAALLVGCAAGDESEELVICSSLPLADGTNERAVAMSRAIEQAIEAKEIVQLGGTSYRLRYVAMDDTSPETGSWDTAQEARNARAAIAEHGCIAYIGTYNSGAAKVAIPILNRVQLPMISPGNTYPGLTKPGSGLGDEPWIYSPLGPDQRNYCRVVPADDLQTPAAARYAAETLGVRRVAIFHDTELYGEGLATLFAQEAEEQGLEVVAGPLGINWRLVLEQGPSGRRAAEIADTLLSGDPELVYFGGTTAHAPGIILQELRDRGYNGYFMGADGIAEDAFVEEADAFDDERIFATLVGTPLEQLPEAGQRWVQEYRARYGPSVDAFAAPSYEAALVVLDAIERAELPEGDTPLLERARPAVLRAMKGTEDFQGILGSWSFDENCDTTDTTISINQVRGGSFELVDTVTSEG